ncbi:MAG TPA: sulfotransferase [Nocardioidaceae bacterium]|nr:sulfotransferase [Nocardioidaceae bacterium]
MTAPGFLVVGAARSGTTGLVEGLRSHPRVFVTEPKEPHYFALHDQTPDFAGPGDAHTINRVAVTDRDRYLALYPASPHDYLALGDGSVSTLYYYERALPEAVAMNPDLRLVVLLREPVARAYSSHQYMRARGFEPYEDFLAAVDDEPRRKAENYHHLWHYTSMSYYADAVAALQKAVPPEQLGIWFYDDLDRDYEDTVRAVLRFLDVPPAEGEAEGVPRVNISGKPRFAGVQKALWWATRHDVLRRGVKRLTTYRFRERIRRLTLRSGGVPPEAMERLQPLFAEDLARLRDLLPPDIKQPDWLREA